MTTRAVGAGAGLTWLQRALNLGRDNPKAIFGGALLLLTTLIVIGVGLALVMTVISLSAGTNSLIWRLISLLTGVAISALMAVLMAGYLQLLDAVEQGRPVSALQVFSVLGQSVVAVRASAFMVLLMLAQNLLLRVLVGLVAPDVDIGSWYPQISPSPENGGTPPALPQGFGPALLIVWAVGLLSYGVQAIGLGQIALRDKGVVDALRDGVTGTLRNLLPLLLLSLLAMAAAVVLALLLLIAALLVGVLAKLLGGWVGVLAVPLSLVLVLALMVVMLGVMYGVWRDVCAAPGSPATTVSNQIEL
jgi:hypothetical protein